MAPLASGRYPAWYAAKRAVDAAVSHSCEGVPGSAT